MKRYFSLICLMAFCQVCIAQNNIVVSPVFAYSDALCEIENGNYESALRSL